MDSTFILKYKNLNFNLKNIIFKYLPSNQILRQITKIDKSTLNTMNKNRVIHFIKNNYYQFKELISKFNVESIDNIKNICNYDSNLTENNIYEIVV